MIRLNINNKSSNNVIKKQNYSKNLYTQKEIDLIKKNISKYSNFNMDNNIKSWYHFFVTLSGFSISLYLVKYSYWFVVPAFLFQSRMFMIFHDLCHHNFFKLNPDEFNKKEFKLNKTVAKIIEPISTTTYDHWVENHGNHHNVMGNLNKYDATRTVITVNQFNNLSPFMKMLYLVLRQPFIYYPLVTLYTFYLLRLNDIGYIIKYLILIKILYHIGGKKLVFGYLLSSFIGGMIGVITFHLQHQVNTGYLEYVDTNDQLSKDNAALLGSSILILPEWLKFFSFGIEYHHIHHLSPRIPGFNLYKCHKENEYHFRHVTKVGYLQAFKSLFHTLYDEKTGRYISFKPYKYIGLQH